jgi:hypothetical protein
MAIRETTWRPDTCGCEIVYSWDDELPEAVRKHDMSKANRRCAAHASHEDIKVHFDTITEENRRKNIAFEEVKKIIPALTPEFYQWEFDQNRILKIVLNGPTNSEKVAVIDALNTRFGSGKTRVE